MSEHEDKTIYIWTDGSTKPRNPGLAGGWAAILTQGKLCAKHSGAKRDATNNEMELRAVIEGLKFLKYPSTVVIYTDSAYVAGGINGWIIGWDRNNWMNSEGNPVKNEETWKELQSLMKIHRVRAIHVKGHADSELNNECDRMAAAAADDLLATIIKEQGIDVETACKQPVKDIPPKDRVPQNTSSQVRPERKKHGHGVAKKKQSQPSSVASVQSLFSRHDDNSTIELAKRPDLPGFMALHIADTCDVHTAKAIVSNPMLFEPQVYARMLKKVRRKDRNVAERIRKKLNLSVAVSVLRTYPDKSTAGEIIKFLKAKSC